MTRVRALWMRYLNASDDGRRSVEQLGILALAGAVATIIGVVLVYGRLPFALVFFLAPATWTLFALVPWNHPADPLRTRQLGFLAVVSALVIFVGVPVMIGPTNMLALTALVLALRLRSPHLAIAALVMGGLWRISAQTWILDSTASVGWHVCVLVVLVGLWCHLAYLRSRTSPQPARSVS